jgi:hypothetical protein
MSARTQLNPATVREIFLDCRSLGSDKAKSLGVPSILTSSVRYFDKQKVKEHQEAIASMLSQLPLEFKSAAGGSFSRTNLDNHEDTWSPAESSQEQLVQLGIAIGKIKIAEPREVWSKLPGGRPTIKIAQ